MFTDKIVALRKIEVGGTTKLYDVTVPKTLNFCIFNGIGLRDKDVSLTASCRDFRGKTVLLASREKIAARLLNCGKCVKLQEPSIYVARDNDLGYGKILEDKTIANPHLRETGSLRSSKGGVKGERSSLCSTTKGAIGLFLGLRYSLPCFEKLRMNSK